MSRRNSSSVSHRIQDLVKQVTETPEEDWPDIFDIEKDPDGSIYDFTYEKSFDSLPEWAKFNVEMEDVEEDDSMIRTTYYEE